MFIAQISDTHIDLGGPSSAVRLGNLEQCVEDINRIDPLPDVVIHTGDLAQNGKPAEYEAARRLLGGLRCPFHVVAGNRDDRDAVRAAFPADDYLLPDTPFVQYTINAFPVRLIVLDTLSESGNQGDFCQSRADNLRAALADEPSRPTALFMHHPPFEILESDYPIQYQRREAIATMSQALDGQRHVLRAFCGHAHRSSMGQIAGVPVSTMPSVAVDLRQGDYPDAVRTVPLYQLHRYDAGRGFVSEMRAARPSHALADAVPA